mmetsp:Transcript_27657/g.41830  ORF Transcript_27657/g.41830 Transcript_27657/m.41830 type:complete len:88 (-) Transcript_27657:117-380(-)
MISAYVVKYRCQSWCWMLGCSLVSVVSIRLLLLLVNLGREMFRWMGGCVGADAREVNNNMSSVQTFPPSSLDFENPTIVGVSPSRRS